MIAGKEDLSKFTRRSFSVGRLLDLLFLPLLIVLVAFAAFALGRLSVERKHEGLKIIEPAGKQEPAVLGLTTGAYVASKSGSKYYLTTCAGAGRIKEENKVFFASAAEAQALGYSPAQNCPGL
jgi:hypothetical protein